MKPTEVRRELRSIRKEVAKGDNEVAHGTEDQLHEDVLEAIRDGEAEDPGELAKLALYSRNIVYQRWFA